jgi:hypothetical protein
MDLVYRIRFTVTVDHPELRDSTYKRVPAAHRVLCTESFESRAAAIRAFDARLSGEDDFSTEFVSLIELRAVRGDNWCLSRRVRAPVRRVRFDVEQAPARAA